MRKKIYLAPEINMYELDTESAILAGSDVPGLLDPSRPGMNYSSRKEDVVWDDEEE